VIGSYVRLTFIVFNVRYFERICYEFILNYNKSVINLTDSINILFKKTLDLFINY